MAISSDLTALLFELQRAGSPADRARAVARAWRTVRGLDRDERRLLAREIGFEGAEELVEGLAGGTGGAFSPAAVLEALASARNDRTFSIRGVMADLRDPDRRQDLLIRGADLVAGSLRRDGAEEPPPVRWSDGETDLEMPDGNEVGAGEPDADRDADGAVIDEPPAEDPVRPEQATRPGTGSSAPLEVRAPEETTSGPGEVRTTEARSSVSPPRHVVLPPAPEPEPAAPRTPEPSLWDELWTAPASMESPTAVAAEIPATAVSGIDVADRHQPRSAGSAARRLRALRSRVDGLRTATADGVRDELAAFPEPWAHRRALVALIDGGVPADPDDAVALIAELDRAVDRRWCLAALARRGDLEGSNLERALQLLVSPAARRRVERLARRPR